MSRYYLMINEDSSDIMWDQLKKAIESQIYIPFTKSEKAIFMFRTQILYICLNILRNVSEKNEKNPKELIGILQDKLFHENALIHEKLLFCYFYIAYTYHDLWTSAQDSGSVPKKSETSKKDEDRLKELESQVDFLNEYLKMIEERFNSRENKALLQKILFEIRQKTKTVSV
jgi:hypothetical protein